MKLAPHSLTLIFFCFASHFVNAQLNRSLEFEIAPIFSDRIFTGADASDNWELNIYEAHSEIIPGFYVQFGANFREDKRTRLYTGLRAINQQVMVSYYNIYSSNQDPNGNWSSVGIPRSQRSDLLYLSLQLGVKQSLIANDNFRMVGEIGIAPGILVAAFSEISGNIKRTSLSAECGFSFEWTLKSGNKLGFKLPSISYSVLPNTLIHGGIKQHNYSVGLGLKYVFSKTGSTN